MRSSPLLPSSYSHRVGIGEGGTDCLDVGILSAANLHSLLFWDDLPRISLYFWNVVCHGFLQIDVTDSLSNYAMHKRQTSLESLKKTMSVHVVSGMTFM